jgi:Dolichyl-phosphate-mannose-protein mannosyltransferase
MPRQPTGFPEWTALATLVGISALVRAWAGTKVAGPWFIPDEVVYAQLGQSLYRFGHFRILGSTPDFFSLVYPLFLGLPLHAAGIVRGYEIAKTLQALAMSLAAVPVYLWGRSLVSPGWALAAAGLTLTVPVLGLTGFLMTEVLFYPVFCLAAWLMARALARPTVANQALALAAILLAALTRLQALVLAPAFVLAMVLEAVAARRRPRGLVRFAPALGALGLVAVAWVAAAAGAGRHVLGAYHVTAGTGYDPHEAFRFVVYHAADLVLVTAVVPVVALISVAVPAFRGRERSPEARAFVAVAIALTATIIPPVGVYASAFSGRIAERNLSFLAPLFFLALALWLDRGAPRSRAVIAIGAAATLGLLLATPWGRFVVPADEPDAFTLVPFVKLHDHLPGLAPTLAVGLAGAALLVLVALPRRLLRFLPLVLGILLAGASVSATRLAASQARTYQWIMVGSEPRWIDRAAPTGTDYLYGGEFQWTGGGPVWANLFWNERIERVDDLFGAHVVGPIPPHRARVAGDGSVLLDVPQRFVVASGRLRLNGVQLASSNAGLVLWRLDRPLRIVTRADGFDPANELLSARAKLVAYACRGVSAALVLLSPDDRVVRLRRNGRPYRSLHLAAGQPWTGSVALPAPRRPGVQPCSLSLSNVLGVRAERLDFLPR